MDRIIGMAAGRLGLPRRTCRAYYRRFLYDLEADQIAGLQAFFDGRRGILDRRGGGDGVRGLRDGMCLSLK